MARNRHPAFDLSPRFPFATFTDLAAARQSDAEIDEFLRQHLESAYHPCGACKMGSPSDPLAVVDPQTRVIGLEGLRVADSSIMPSITSGNLNAPTIMIGEKAADMILAEVGGG